jgi:hypothetical protein
MRIAALPGDLATCFVGSELNVSLVYELVPSMAVDWYRPSRDFGCSEHRVRYDHNEDDSFSLSRLTIRNSESLSPPKTVSQCEAVACEGTLGQRCDFRRGGASASCLEPEVDS